MKTACSKWKDQGKKGQSRLLGGSVWWARNWRSKGLDVGARECDVSAMSQAAGIRLPDNELMTGGEWHF